MTDLEILLEARRRAALRAKYPLVRKQILLGKKDDRANVIKAQREVQREIAFAKQHDMRPLRPEEDEPCFAGLIQRAKARAEELRGTADGEMIAELVAAYEHAETEAEMIYWNASDNRELPHGA